MIEARVEGQLDLVGFNHRDDGRNLFKRYLVPDGEARPLADLPDAAQARYCIMRMAFDRLKAAILAAGH